MKRNFLTLFILVLVIAFATCFMITGCQQKPEEETPQSSIDNGRRSFPQSVGDGSNDPASVTSTPGTTTSDPGTTSSDDGGTTSSDGPGTTSSEEGNRPSDTPIYNSGN